MNKKLKKDFAERQKIKEEAKLLGKDSFDIDESSKLTRLTPVCGMPPPLIRNPDPEITV